MELLAFVRKVITPELAHLAATTAEALMTKAHCCTPGRTMGQPDLMRNETS
jgi:hypothetical protein